MNTIKKILKKLITLKEYIIKNIKDKNKIEKENRNFNNCNICNEDIRNIGCRFNCKYCGGFFCKKHRLPEEHNCENPTNPHIETKDIFNFKKQ